jgi:hypothetical protein
LGYLTAVPYAYAEPPELLCLFDKISQRFSAHLAHDFAPV